MHQRVYVSRRPYARKQNVDVAIAAMLQFGHCRNQNNEDRDISSASTHFKNAALTNLFKSLLASLVPRGTIQQRKESNLKHLTE